MILMIATIEMKEDLCRFSMNKNHQNSIIFEKMPPLTGLMKDVQSGSTLYIRRNGDAEIGMLKSDPKILIFFSMGTYHHDIDV